jgi:hypothetical protein
MLHWPVTTSRHHEVAYGLLVATPTQALPLVSLYLRAQGQFINWPEAGRQRHFKDATISEEPRCQRLAASLLAVTIRSRPSAETSTTA